MTTLEELGLLKMDFLGLRNLTVLDDAVKTVRRKRSPDFKLADIAGERFRRPMKCSPRARRRASSSSNRAA